MFDFRSAARAVHGLFEGPAKGIRGAWPMEELQLQQVRLLPEDETEVESRADVDLIRDFKGRHGQTIQALPVIAANMFGVGTVPMARAFREHNMLVAMEKNTDIWALVSFYNDKGGVTAIPSIGFQDGDKARLKQIFAQAGKNVPHSITIDVPNGHMAKMLRQVAALRQDYPDAYIIAGNAATGSMARKIILAGADAVKVGIGPGSACTTKLIAGTHRPQFAAIRDCARAVHPLGGHIIADGGIRTAGDVAIALAAGGDMVMIGGAFAAHDESGEPIYIDDRGREWQEFMGSSSAEYMRRTKGEVAHYRAAEGELQWIPHKGGSIDRPGAIVDEILGGLRSAFSYAGAGTAQAFSDMARATYLGRSGGLTLVKAQMDGGGSGKGQPSQIVGGRPNPITGKEPRPELIRA